MKTFKLPFNRIWLLVIGVVLATLIMSFGNAQYQKEINKPKDNQNQQPINNEIVENTKLEAVNNQSNESKEQVDKLTKKQNIDQNNNLAKKQANSDSVTNNNKDNKSNQNINTTTNIDYKETVQTLNLIINSVGSYEVEYKEGDTGWDTMQRAAKKYIFPMKYQVFDFGIYIISIGGIEPEYGSYWALYYNNQYSMIGIKDLKVNPHDTITWQVESWQ